MKNLNCNIVHLEHSSFLVETKNNILIFDYFNDSPMLPEGNIEKGILTEDIFKTDKDIFVFATHSHSDHYNPVIFNWKRINPKFLVPIHFRNNFYICKDFAKLLDNSLVKIIEFGHKGQNNNYFSCKLFDFHIYL